ncbi:MAG: hypothetical protein HYX51_09085 [Chloroflexi bacterium]|nr:hypothetical protein [Chloroflexota bacterium]
MGTWLKMAVALLIAGLALAEVLRAGILAPMRRMLRGRTSACAACGYDLTGLASPGHCPECATAYLLITRVEQRASLDWRRCWIGPACFAVAMVPQFALVEFLRRWWVRKWETSTPGPPAWFQPGNAVRAGDLLWPLSLQVGTAILVVLVSRPHARVARLLVGAAAVAAVFAAAHTLWLPECWRSGAWVLEPMPWWWAAVCVGLGSV